MGFFSKIKKLWKRDKTEESQASLEEKKEIDISRLSVDEKVEKDISEALAKAEPRLSVWLDILLQGINQKGDELWSRLKLFFAKLEVPEEEARDFILKFQRWLDKMEYTHISEFRSELQYQLALALELEDEEDERSRLFIKLSEGLAKTKAQLSKQINNLLANSSGFNNDFWEQLEEILIMADVGFEPTIKLIDNLKLKAKELQPGDQEGFKKIFSQELAQLFPKPSKKLVALKPEVVLIIGVNGVGKTTTIAKLAYRAQMQGKKVLMVAGDTFRAAAIEQLKIWADRVGVDIYAKDHGADPAAVAYEAMDKATQENYDLVLVDTAGRLHTKVNLMEELAKIKRVLNKKHPGSPHRTILVVDATTGQNALSQVELFSKSVNIDEIILTKLDGTAKGGVVVGIACQYNIPITYVGLGEKMEDLRPFDGQSFAQALLMD
ncbi:MAG: signal recognition particle-docking protein FtsY [Desulfonauticus sp.]|nr:signal recognition particle-docking protein FtsY [Desulfonauticus sp.]